MMVYEQPKDSDEEDESPDEELDKQEELDTVDSDEERLKRSKADAEKQIDSELAALAEEHSDEDAQVKTDT